MTALATTNNNGRNIAQTANGANEPASDAATAQQLIAACQAFSPDNWTDVAAQAGGGVTYREKITISFGDNK